MASLHIYATRDEVAALNKLEKALTIAGMTTNPRRFALAEQTNFVDMFHSPNEMLVYVYDRYDHDQYDVKSGIDALKELRSILDLTGWIAAEKLKLKERLLGFAEITAPRLL